VDGGVVHEKDDPPIAFVFEGLCPCLQKIQFEHAGVNPAFNHTSSKDSFSSQRGKHRDSIGTGTVVDGIVEQGPIDLFLCGPIIIEGKRREFDFEIFFFKNASFYLIIRDLFIKDLL
jgi:hypothetical protein